MTGINRASSRFVSTCPCGKKTYATRADARRAARRIKDGSMRAYRCIDEPDGLWHIGHLPKAVKAGERTAGQIFRRSA